MRLIVGKEFLLNNQNNWGWWIGSGGFAWSYLEEYADNTKNTNDKFNDAMSIL